MLDIIIIILLLSGLFIGLKRGFIRQFIRLITFIAAIAVAGTYYGDLAPKLGWIPSPDFSGGQAALAFVSGSIEGAYYNMIAFLILFFLTIILLRIAASFLDAVASIPIIKQINQILGAVLGFAEIYLFVFVVLFIGALLPIDALQSMMSNSVLADLIIHKTPYLSNMLNNLMNEYGSL
ncbi:MULTISPECIES: CvpA family protein [Bacillus]|uniref:CvpA family protein n=1 Tax=Bacillus TaxID=1386 RepID=UPI0003F7121A|nr:MULTISPECIES: CvpA family protein [Bacillus]QHZ47976.1 CvpA family protein [Bacillus sp. NSP9.1]WFA04058.1 CvpA family protein [Bacillus sp. HSf4]